ncbi:MAG: flagellar hook-length control protein FliK [Oceanospirillaceae bacterium]|nr:flagellar hook-length control protein FliK [Oceanospirillaceae bacterium]
MRTDSNTILSLPSGAPPKKSNFAKVPASNSGAFADDFRKAKEVNSPKKRAETDTSSASTSSTGSSPKTNGSSEAGDTSSVKSSSKTAATTNNSEVGKEKSTSENNDSSNRVSDDKVAVQDSSQLSGKELQQEGEALPTEESLSEGEVSPVNELSLAGIGKAAESKNSTLEGVSKTVSGDAVDSSLANLNNPPLKSSDSSLLSKTVNSDGMATEELSTGNADSKIVGASVIAGLGAIKRGASNETKVDASTKLVALSDGDLVKEEKALSSDQLEAGADEADSSELSWVLSQMGASGAKSTAVNSGGDAVLDTSKAALATAGVVAGASDRTSRSDSVPSSLLGDVSSPDDLGSDSADSLLAEDGIFIDEPIELRKKEHEAMLGRMSAQADGSMGADNSSGGLNSSLHNNMNRAAALGGAAVAANAAPNSTANLAMTLPPGHPGWAGEMSQKVAWIARDGGHTAHIRLDPPELGSLTVKVSVDSDSNTQISFVAATPQARDLLEGQMGRLRDMLAQQGMDLSRADVDVSQQDTSGAQDRANHRNNDASGNGIAVNDDIDDELIPKNLSYVSATGVDYYA